MSLLELLNASLRITRSVTRRKAQGEPTPLNATTDAIPVRDPLSVIVGGPPYVGPSPELCPMVARLAATRTCLVGGRTEREYQLAQE